jgi:hypothetical protein
LADSYWSISANPGGPVTASAYKVNGSPSSYPFPAWAADNGTSGWIAPQANYSVESNVKDAAGAWVYKTTFTLSSDLNPATAAIVGRWMADDQGTQVTLNGTPLGLSTGLSQFSTWYGFTIGAGSPFVTGLNTLLFTVNNIPPQSPANPDGLRVEFTSATADLVVPEPATFGLIGLGLLALAAISRRKQNS